MSPYKHPDNAGQFNEATYNLVQLKKVLEDSSSGGKTHNPELQQLQQAVFTCTRDLDKVWSGCSVFTRDSIIVWRCLNSGGRVQMS